MEIKRILLIQITHYLRCELRNSKYPESKLEHIISACNSLQTAFEITNEDIESISHNDLLTIYSNTVTENYDCLHSSNEENEKSQMAENFKYAGNQLMLENKFAEAFDAYSKAINLVHNNPVYFCNRAAAYCKLNDFHHAMEDCQRAIDIDSNYSKAHARMGLSYSSLGNYRGATECYKRALSIDPVNQSYQRNLSAAQKKWRRDAALQTKRDQVADRSRRTRRLRWQDEVDAEAAHNNRLSPGDVASLEEQLTESLDVDNPQTTSSSTESLGSISSDTETQLTDKLQQQISLSRSSQNNSSFRTQVSLSNSLTTSNFPLLIRGPGVGSSNKASKPPRSILRR